MLTYSQMGVELGSNVAQRLLADGFLASFEDSVSLLGTVRYVVVERMGSSMPQAGLRWWIHIFFLNLMVCD